jgi:hypothetical protein
VTVQPPSRDRAVAAPRDTGAVIMRILAVIAGVAIALGAAELLGGDEENAAAPDSRSQVPCQVASSVGPHLSFLASPVTGPPTEAAAAHASTEGPVLPGDPLLPWSEVVTDAGEAVPGALVLLGDLDSPSWSDIAGGDGRFVLSEFPSYDTLRAVAVRGGEAWIGSTPVDGGPFPWTVVVRPPASSYERVVVVRVLDPVGRPIPRATAVPVSGRARGESPAGEGFRVSGGAFVVPAARWHRGEAPVFLLQEPRDEENRPLPLGEATVAVDPEGPAEVEVRLPSGGLVGGRLLDADGSPRPGATLTFQQHPVAASGVARVTSTLTDRDGRFLFASGPGGGRLQATALAGSGPVVAAPGETELVVQLREEASLRLLVVDFRGDPVESGRVYAKVVDEGDRRAWRALATDGTCTLSGLPAGCEVALSVSAGGSIRHEGSYRVDDSLLRIELPRAAVLRGRVVDSHGGGVPGATVFASPPGDLAAPWTTADLSGPDGVFSLDGIPADAPVRLSVGDGARVLLEREIVAGGGEEIVLALSAAEEFLLVYVDGGDGRTESAPVVVSSGGRVVARGYALDLPALVAIPAADLAPCVDVAVGPTTWYAAFAIIHGVPSRGILRPDMERTVAVKGRVLHADGRSAAFARGRAEGQGGLAVVFEADAQGRFRAYGLPPGPVIVTAEAFDGSSGRVACEAPAEEAEVVLVDR